jgi:hypothetical protein
MGTFITLSILGLLTLFVIGFINSRTKKNQCNEKKENYDDEFSSSGSSKEDSFVDPTWQGMGYNINN